MKWRVYLQEVNAMGHEWLRKTGVVVEAPDEQQALAKALQVLPGYGAFLKVKPEEGVPDGRRDL